MDSVDNLMANTRNNPIEELDLRFPMRCDQYELRRRAGGAGQVARRHRDRPPQPLPRRRARTRARATATTDPPRGIFGGWDGLVASTPQEPRHGGTRSTSRRRSPASSSRRASTSSSASRTPAATATRSTASRAMVREDVLDDFTTIELARDAYGVVFVDERDFEIDAEATERPSRGGARGAQRRAVGLARRALPPRERQAPPQPSAGVGGGERAVRDGVRMGASCRAASIARGTTCSRTASPATAPTARRACGAAMADLDATLRSAGSAMHRVERITLYVRDAAKTSSSLAGMSLGDTPGSVAPVDVPARGTVVEIGSLRDDVASSSRRRRRSSTPA